MRNEESEEYFIYSRIFNLNCCIIIVELRQLKVIWTSIYHFLRPFYKFNISPIPVPSLIVTLSKADILNDPLPELLYPALENEPEVNPPFQIHFPMQFRAHSDSLMNF